MCSASPRIKPGVERSSPSETRKVLPPARSSPRHAHDRRHKITHEDQTASIIDGGKGQRHAFVNCAHERQEIPFHSSTVNQWRSENSRRHRRACSNSLQLRFSLKLGNAVRVFRTGLITLPERPIGCALAIDLDGRKKDEATDTLTCGRLGKAFRHFYVYTAVFGKGIGCRFTHHMGPRCEMNHSRHPPQRLPPIGIRAELSQHHIVCRYRRTGS